MKDPLLLNKIIAGILVVALFVLGTNQISKIIFADASHTEDDVLVNGITIEGFSASSAQASTKTNMLEPITDEVLSSASSDRGQKIFNLCKSCHTIEKGGPNLVGPNLYGIFSSDIGSKSDFKYSKNMRDYPGNWSIDELNAFLYAPLKFFDGKPGMMNFVGLKKVEDRASIIKFLNSNSDSPKNLP